MIQGTFETERDGPNSSSLLDDMRRLLQIRPRPLIHPAGRFIIIFSEKSACTNVVIWFLTQLGHAKAAQDFDGWPHEYRIAVYYRSQLYENALRSDDLTEFKTIRVIRDPFDRAVSSFRHILRFDIIDDDINQTIQPRTIAQDGLSFAEFLTFLESIDLNSCNPHLSIQRHPVEDRRKVDYVINISQEDLFERLNQIEVDLGLMPTSLEKDGWVLRHSSHNRPRSVSERSGGIYHRRLTRNDARHGPWPRHEDLLTSEAREKIARLYAKDIESYLSERSQ